MRRHYANYFKGIEHFKEYRMKLVSANSVEEIYTLFREIAEQKLEVVV
jgi:tRNA-dihydrouridine synthase